AGGEWPGKTARAPSLRVIPGPRDLRVPRKRGSGRCHAPPATHHDFSERRSMPILDKIAETQLWKSIFRHPMPTDRRTRAVVMLTNFFLRLHPVSVRKQGIALSYTWCMGGTTFFLFIVEVVTGVLLMFYYRPTLEHAYNDILALRDVTTLGILRELHRW